MKYISEENLRKWILTENCNDGCGYIDERDLVNMEWEEEPFINKPCISTGVCHEDKVKVLDKIRAEIERLHYHPKLDFIKNDEVVDLALDIIDKYTKGEQG